MARMPTPFRHIDKDKKVHKVERDEEKNLYIAGTDQKLKPGQFTHKNNVVTHKGKGGIQKQQPYDEWWQESNLDGSFAYNGVTDDF